MSLKIRKKYLFYLVFGLTLVSLGLFVLKNQRMGVLPSPRIQTVSSAPSETTSESAIGNSQEYNKIKSVADSDGVQAAWKYVIDTYGKDNAKQLEAHDYAHYVGGLIYEKLGLDGMSLCTSDFAFGCYHGLLDKAFRKDLTPLSAAEKACEKVGTSRSGPYASCIHGIGHGIASFFKDKDLTQALKACDKLPEGAPQYCYDGVFMEFSNDALDDFYKKNDPLFPCDAVTPEYIFACGRNQPTVLMKRFKFSFDQIYQACKTAKDKNLRTSCYVSLGFQSVYQSSEDPTQIITKCGAFKDSEFEYQCKSAAAGELVFQNINNWQTNSPMICNSITRSDQQKLCNDHITQIQKSYNR